MPPSPLLSLSMSREVQPSVPELAGAHGSDPPKSRTSENPV
jgi:hypothetical protein